MTSTLSRLRGDPQARLGFAFAGTVLVAALLGPLAAPQSPLGLVGPTYGLPGAGTLLGYDYLGRDVWSRLLHGGRSVLWMSFAASVIALAIGAVIGIAAGLSKRWVDHAVVWGTDVLLAFPDLILVLLVVSMLGREPWLIVLTVAVSFVPGVIRLARGVTLGVVSQEYVEAAKLMGYPWWRIVLLEILPNISTPLLVHLGIMLTWAIGMLSGLSFLGYGVAPPAADWGLMINENRAGLMIQPWAVLAPVAMIGFFALGTNLLAESVSRAGSRIAVRKGVKSRARTLMRGNKRRLREQQARETRS
ncbi:ABC transporter permease [Novosphingobium sp. P6W]|uniref:ABC transporter permease n=1 Tax=Novosphingobium sp. P6W TaxID=1609758 RepID=UPI0005C318AF|nr:ABC transporter permease [Novosphingobium sp. P6W]AXB78520.1 ABC transporter permease [Novosphingobium sp. P6W]KIS30602.1 peptide ABC transporter permease [Novosphingobium sp. P6W]